MMSARFLRNYLDTPPPPLVLKLSEGAGVGVVTSPPGFSAWFVLLCWSLINCHFSKQSRTTRRNYRGSSGKPQKQAVGIRCNQVRGTPIFCVLLLSLPVAVLTQCDC